MLSEVATGYVRAEAGNGIRTIEFFHPQSNSLPGALLTALTKEVQTAAADSDTKVVILRSGGERAFCAGASFDELLAIDNEQQGFEFFSGFANLINAMRKCPKFILLRVQGKCVGGGVGIAAAADYAIASQNADVKLSELAVGIGPFVVGPAVERKIGTSAFGSLSIDAASWRSAAWAHQHGLFAELHENITGADDSIQRLAHTLAQSNPEAMMLLKENLWTDTAHWDQLLPERAAFSGRLVCGDFARKAIHQFKKK